MFRPLPVLLPFSYAANPLCRFNRSGVTTEIQKGMGPGSAPGPIFSINQNEAASEAPTPSSGAAEPEAFPAGSGSPRSSLRTTSARIDHDVILVVADFLLLPLGRS